ncbi:uncharacterized protein LOC129803470 [Phlebotomus papatasi]|uniref:uncharacterized protein LOC129803470 n=1 Tax=Phlebotomus papatasi TaxID=29031 RepID=UPI0024838295|nr:uncharacterized protein LOC129803470 [Phlebotomus papatasi]
MSVKCRVPGCGNTNLNCDSSIAFHLPSKEMTAEQWDVWREFCGESLSNVPTTDKTPQRLRICSLHFAEGDFKTSTRSDIPQLAKNAIPRIRNVQNLPQLANEEHLVLENVPENTGVAQPVCPENNANEYILSDNLGIDEDSVPTLLLTDNPDAPQENQLLVNESEEYYILDESDHTVKINGKIIKPKGTIRRFCPPPLLTFDGRLLNDAQKPSGVEDTTKETVIVQEVLARESAAPPHPSLRPRSELMQVDSVFEAIEGKGCEHLTEYEAKLNEVMDLEWEVKRLTESNGQLTSSIRRMNSDINQSQRTFGQLFTPIQMSRIQGFHDAWQKRDYERALFYKYLAPKAYKYLKIKYKFPLPSMTQLRMFEKTNRPTSLAVFREVSVYKQINKNRINLLGAQKK